MSLRLIYGRAGSGKTSFCMEEIRDMLIQEAKGPLILVVPEQYSMQAERDLLKIAPKAGVMEAEVLSFRRMAYRIFEEVGGYTRRHISASGRSMLIYRVMDELKEELRLFERAAHQSGFVGTMAQLISEFKRYNITPEIFHELNNTIEDETLKDKLGEIGAIYQRFEEAVHKRYIDADDDLTLLAEKLPKSKEFHGAHIWIDEFSGFTPQEYRVIEELMKKAERVSLCLCTDYLVDEGAFFNEDVFAPVRGTASKIIEIARNNNIAIEKPIGFRDKPYPRFRESPELAHLEEHYFAFPYKKHLHPTQDIEIFTANNIYTEIEEAARNIRALCRKEGYRYRDIALVTGDLSGYERLISAIFPQYGIPFFIDMKRRVDSHPLVTLVLSMMDIFIHNWSYEGVFRYLKTGLIGIPRNDIDILENYVLANGIRGREWTREDAWEYRPESGFSQSQITEAENAIINKVNETRIKIIKPLMDFRNKTKGRTPIRIICTSLYEFLVELGVPTLIEERIESLEEAGALALANEYGQIWNIVMEVLDQTVEAMGEESMGIERFRDILSIGFSEHKIGLIPPSLDQVLVGSVDRSRSHEIKALFILGVNDGIFPAPAEDEGILTDEDRNTLRKLGVELAPDTRSQAFEEQFTIYSTLTTTGGKLYLSYPIADQEGRTMRPSIIISRVKKLFPRAKKRSNLVEGTKPWDLVNDISAPLPTFNELIFATRQATLGQGVNPLWDHARKWYQDQDPWKDRAHRVKQWMDYTNQVDNMDTKKVARLYGSPMYSSISRMEQYASCPFSFYLRYGLKAKDRIIHSLSPPDLGSFMHDAIEIFSTRLMEANIEWDDLERDWCEKEISSIVDELLEKKMGWLVNNSDRYRYLVIRLKRVINRAIWIIAEHIKRSAFKPLGYELSFGDSKDDTFPPIVLELPTGEKIHLVGRIDRIDAMKNEEGTYIRIIDYKSGSQAFNLSDVYYGLQIQLVTYLSGILQSGEKALGDKVLPGGMLYFKLDDPFIRSDGPMDEEAIEKAIMKELKMRGLVLADVRLIKGMDRDIDGHSTIIPARVNKNGSLGKPSSTATLEQFNELFEFSKNLLGKLAKEMMGGRAEIKPFREGDSTACRYCPYPSICQFDPSLKDNNYRIIKTMKENEVWNTIKKEGDDR